MQFLSGKNACTSEVNFSSETLSKEINIVIFYQYCICSILKRLLGKNELVVGDFFMAQYERCSRLFLSTL